MLKIVVDDDDNEYGLDKIAGWHKETKERVSKIGGAK